MSGDRYYINDHLGNTRIAFKDNNGDGSINIGDNENEILQETNYYPFGMSFAEQNINYSNKNLYNGKELQDNFDLNWYDYGARFKDGTRWTTIDPLAELYYSTSPYAYVRNSPINRYDPNGMFDDEFGNRHRPPEEEGDDEEDENDDPPEGAKWIYDEDGNFKGIHWFAEEKRSPYDGYSLSEYEIDAMFSSGLFDGAGGQSGKMYSEEALRITGHLASFGTGAIGFTQIGMLKYRSFLSINSKVGTFSSFASKYGTLGRFGGRLTYFGAGVSLISNIGEVRSGEIGAGRFTYRIGSLGASIGTGAMIGGPWGAVGGAAVGGISIGLEYFHDNYLVPLGQEIQYQIWNFENAIKNGWYPGR